MRGAAAGTTLLFPAHAGMDRAAVASLQSGWVCSPHTRGWTVNRCRSPRLYSAVPRTRGDGPLTTTPAVTTLPTVPRTRGDVPIRKAVVKALELLFPAHAGMDRPSVRSDRSEARLFPAHAGMDRTPDSPRPRNYPCSPHTRGWTARHVMATDGSATCSPHTRGWTGKGTAGPQRLRAVPRTRGDGPALRVSWTSPLSLFPAHAGMDRTRQGN